MIPVLAATLVVIGVLLVGFAMALAIPALAVIGGVYLLGGWLSRARGSSGRSWLRVTIGSLAVVVGVMLVLGVGYLWRRGSAPVPDAFYDPASAPPATPGTLLRAEPFTRVVPTNTRVWRILYTTTRADNVPAVASAIVLAPLQGSSEPRPIVAWTHGTTGVAAGCAPSVLPSPFPFDSTLPALEQLIAERWVLVGTDYVGLGTTGGHPYLIGEPEGRSALDAVRAVRQLPEVSVEPRTVVWGYSQGGHAALWTGILAPRYAPDVNLIGVAALAPATDIAPLVDAAQHTTVGRIMTAFVMAAYSEAYPDVQFDDYVVPGWRARAMAARCLSGPGALASVLTSLTMETAFFRRPPTDGPLGERFRQNVPVGQIIAPLLIAQGLSDDLVLPGVQEKFVRERCAGGQRLEYRTYAGRGHLGLVAADSPLTEDLVRWTRDRLASVPIEDGCRTVPIER